jgi:glycosyltransferase involved in cell wall biosynthesis
MSGMPPVSVIVPTHNGERFLHEALVAIAHQTYPDIELIVVDDGSDDDSAAVAAAFLDEFPCGQLVRRPVASGVATARNLGVARASGSLLAFCDQDDVWLPDKLERQLSYLDDHSEVAIVLVRQEPFLDGIESLPGWLLPDRVFGDLGGVLPCTALIRREAFTVVGEFDPEKSGSDDFDWLLRARHCGLGVSVLPEVLVRRRLHEGNGSHDAARMRSGLFGILRDLVHDEQAPS